MVITNAMIATFFGVGGGRLLTRLLSDGRWLSDRGGLESDAGGCALARGGMPRSAPRPDPVASFATGSGSGGGGGGLEVECRRVSGMLCISGEDARSVTMTCTGGGVCDS